MTPARPAIAVLSRKALNRALLERQLLLRRATMPVLDAIEHLVGMQAQVPGNPYIALWSRLQAYRFDDLSRLITERRAVRTTMMRGTIHLFSARDALGLRSLMQPALERDVYPNVTFGKEKLDGLEMDAVLSAGRDLIDEAPRTAAQLRELLAPRWPDRDPAALAYAVRVLLPVVHVPPRGIWGRSGPIAFAVMESWLGDTLSIESAPDGLIMRYLAAFGPAMVADAATWSGLRGLREVFDRLRPSLRTFRDEQNRELFDLPDAPLPDADVPSPPRFLPEFDNVLLSHADRNRVIADGYRKAIATRNGAIPGTILVNGFVSGIWTIDRDKNGATLTIKPFERIPKKDTAALESAAARLLTHTAADAPTRSVRFVHP
ncbi:MAG: winged helix DNA-binding domain-containing protein [Haloechinothrix sp.]